MLFVAAEAREFGGLLPFCKSVERLDWPLAWARRAELNGRKIVLAANGAGPKLAAEAVDWARSEAGNGSMEAVVSTGFCGGLDPGLQIGDVFVATGIQTGDEVAAVGVPGSRRKYFSGTLISMDR